MSDPARQIRVAQCGAHSYDPDEHSVCRGCGGHGTDSHWGHGASDHSRPPDAISTPRETIKAVLLYVQRRIGNTVWNVPDGSGFIRFNAEDVAEALHLVPELHVPNGAQADDLARLRPLLDEMKCAVHPTVKCRDRVAYQHACKCEIEHGRWVQCENCRLYPLIAELVATLARVTVQRDGGRPHQPEAQP